MSYILDALRKADAQRERDPARGIHALGATAWPAGRTDSAARRLWPWGLALLALAVVLAAAAWWLVQPAAPRAVVPVAGITSAAAVPAAPPGPVMRAPVPANEVQPAAPPAAPVPPAPPVLAAARPPALAAIATPAPAVPRDVQGLPSATPAAPVAASAAGVSDRLLSITELPADIQRELPKLAITGGVYSTNAAQRLLIVNGQVLNEGAEAAPGVRLAQIRPKTAVLVFRGYRYGVAY